MIRIPQKKAKRGSSAQSYFRSPFEWAESGHESVRPEPFQTGEVNSVLDPLRPEIRQVASAGIDYLSNLLHQLAELMQDCQSDEEDERPTQAAFEEAIGLLLDATIDLGRQKHVLPRGRATTDSNGALRIEWRRPSACVLLVVPRPNMGQGTYLYREKGPIYDVAHRVNCQSLANALKQLEPQVTHRD
jgi:hypothetical protein